MINVKEYIESGIIEDYVLGLLTAPERSDVERYLILHNEIAAELESVTASLSIFAVLGAVEPKPYMQQRIWDAVGSLTASTKPNNAEASIIQAVGKKSNTNIKSWFAYSSVAVLVLISVFAIYWSNSANKELEGIYAQIKMLSKENNVLSAKVIALNEEIENSKSIYELPNKKIIELIGKSNKAKNSLAIAIWDQENGDVYLDIKKIPENPEGTNYQLYALTQIGQEIKVGPIDFRKKKKISPIGKVRDAILFKIILENEDRNNSIKYNELFLDGKVQI